MIRRPISLLALLTALNLLNYLDRFVLSAVLPRVQKDLALSNFAAGSLATIFLLGYFLTSPFFGALADKRPRKGLLAIGIALWSAATLASGEVTTLLGLVIARALVGVGEASYATLAPTLIDDVAPPEKKGRWLAVFYVATPVGSALGYFTGGLVEKLYGWRAAFFVAGAPGLLLALLCLLIAEPPRKVAPASQSALQHIPALVRLRLYRRGVLGYCAYTFAVGAFAFWAPSFLVKRYGLTLSVANFRFGLMTVVAGIVSTALGGSLSDRASARKPTQDGRVVGAMRVCAIGSAIGAPFAMLAFLSPNANVFFIAAFACELAVFLVTSPINAVLLQSVPTEFRASAMALSIFAIHLFGDLWSPPLVGALADAFPFQIAMLALPIAFGASALLWWVREVKRPECP